MDEKGTAGTAGETHAQASSVEIDPAARAFYCRTLTRLSESKVPFLVGGAYALARYTGIERHTKDFDIFVHERDRDRTLAALAADGCRTDIPFPHWLAKAYCGEEFVDVIYSSGNAVAAVDDEWFAHAVDGEVLGMPVKLCPAEEIIWSKAYVMERERYDGADIAHLLRACAPRLDWERLLRRFGAHWRVLLSHLVLFGFVYPTERAGIPAAVMRELTGRLDAELEAGEPSADKLCQGTYISREQYLIDIGQWGYRDARLAPAGTMSAHEIATWTDAIGKQ